MRKLKSANIGKNTFWFESYAEMVFNPNELRIKLRSNPKALMMYGMTSAAIKINTLSQKKLVLPFDSSLIIFVFTPN